MIRFCRTNSALSFGVYQVFIIKKFVEDDLGSVESYLLSFSTIQCKPNLKVYSDLMPTTTLEKIEVFSIVLLCEHTAKPT